MRVLVLVILLASVAHADTDDRIATEATAHFDRAVVLAKRGDNAAALAEFEKAYALIPQWELLFNIGITQRTLFRYGAAIKTLERYLAGGGDKVPADRRRKVENELAELHRLVGEVVVTIDGGPARIEIDSLFEGESPLTILVAPGPHVVRATRTGEISDERRISVVSGEHVEVKLAPHAAPTTARITIATRPPGANIRVDDGPRTLAPWIGMLDRGGHRITAELAGHQIEHTELVVDAGQERTLTLDLVALPHERHRPLYRRPAFWVAIAVGVAAAVGTTVYFTQPEDADVVLHWP